MQIPTNYKMGSGLAATIMGQQAGLEAEQQGLANLTAAMRQPQDMVKSEEAMAQMNDPRYIQMKLQNDMAKFGKETSINEIESAYNNSNRALAHLKAAQAMGPQALQQASMQYLQRMNIDPNSEQGQILLRDPIGNAEKMVQFYSTAATNNPEYLRQYSLENVKGDWHMKGIAAQGENALKVANVRSAGGGGSAVTKARNKILTAGPQSVINYAGAALKTGVDPLTKQPLDEYDRQILQAYYDEAQATLSSKGGGGIEVTDQGVKIQPRGVRQVPGQTSSNDFSGTASAFAPTSDPLGIR